MIQVKAKRAFSDTSLGNIQTGKIFKTTKEKAEHLNSLNLIEYETKVDERPTTNKSDKPATTKRRKAAPKS